MTKILSFEKAMAMVLSCKMLVALILKIEAKKISVTIHHSLLCETRRAPEDKAFARIAAQQGPPRDVAAGLGT
ncbi:MAG: hypothetical protein NTV34_16560 [Proteobacteria bacterium]|nr:hypothetical protein [Pseudomonadota bacterium]